MLNTRTLNGVNKKENGVTLNVKNVKSEEETSLEVDVVLVSIGRHAFTGGLGLENTGVKTNDRGQVLINNSW